MQAWGKLCTHSSKKPISQIYRSSNSHQLQQPIFHYFLWRNRIFSPFGISKQKVRKCQQNQLLLLEQLAGGLKLIIGEQLHCNTQRFKNLLVRLYDQRIQTLTRIFCLRSRCKLEGSCAHTLQTNPFPKYHSVRIHINSSNWFSYFFGGIGFFFFGKCN